MIPALLCAIAAGPFHVSEANGHWQFVGPDRKPFFSTGVCCVNRGLAAKERDPLNPGFGASRFYSNDRAFAADTAKRLHQWGFNTIGAWGDHELFRNAGLYQMPVLHLSASGIPWVDPWDEATVKKVREVAAPQIARWRSLPGLVGYFSDNELGWWIGALFEWGWKGGEKAPERKRLIDLTQKLYPTWSGLKEDFDVGDLSGFDELRKGGRLFLKPGKGGMRLVRAWAGVLADRYYSLCREVIHELHPGALFLGDRFISGYYPEVARAAGKYCDVVSTNLNADWPNGEIAPYYLSGLWGLTKRPILITEYYACAMENRSGNMNDSSGFPTVATQAERVASARIQMAEFLRKPYVVGAHWFQYYDEPTHGRGDGENYNMGLVDVDNQPYGGLVKTLLRPLPLKPSPKGVPFVSPVKARHLQDWPLRDVLPRTSGEPRGDAFVAWNPSGLYVAVYWNEDRFFENLYRYGRAPDQDRARITIRIGRGDPIEAVIGEQSADVDGAHLQEISTGVRNTIVLRIAANRLGKRALVAGATGSIAVELSTRARGYRLQWQGPWSASRESASR